METTQTERKDRSAAFQNHPTSFSNEIPYLWDHRGNSTVTLDGEC